MMSFGMINGWLCLRTTWIEYDIYAKASPWHGQLSPVMFLASLTGSGTQNYSSPELLYLFDESEGQFIYANVNSSAANRACSELGIYAGYSLLYGTHTASPNQAVAVLGNGSVYRMLYLKLPRRQAKTAARPFYRTG